MIILFLFLTGLTAGAFGALLGLGGGVIVIPVLTMLFNLPIQTAIGVSLVGVIATSTGVAIVQGQQDRADIRLGMVLELGTAVGAIAGALIATYVSQRVLYLLFAGLLIYNSYSIYRKKEEHDDDINKSYKVKNIEAGVVMSGFAGIMSGLLGVGGGLIKVPVMYLKMGVPLRIAAATSNFMIGVTAAASVVIYYQKGSIDPVVAVPVILGVLLGALTGTRLQEILSVGKMKKVFVVVFLYVASQMIWKGFNL